jgi:orotate phosphoribosyltransferase
MTEAEAPGGHGLPRHHLHTHAAAVAGVLEAVYEACLFEQASRPYHYERSGQGTVAEWALDLRRPLSRSTFLRPLAIAMNEELRRLGIRQVAGYGYGSFALVGGMVATGDDLRSVLIREERKRHGFRDIMEGSIDVREPVAIIDDLLSTGRTALRSAAILREHAAHPTVALTVFRYSWRGGRELLRYHGIGSQSLASLSAAWAPAQDGIVTR